MTGVYRVTDDWTLGLGAGASFGGDMMIEGMRYTLSPGPVVALSAGYRVLAPDGWIPFVLVNVTGSLSSVATEGVTMLGDVEQARMTAIDARGSLTIGEVFADVVAPYATVRGFGGPVFWERNALEVRGSDENHYQLGAGLLITAGVFDAYAEVIPMGERALTAGAAVKF